MIRKILISGLLAVAASAAVAASYQPDDITGVWRTKSGGYLQIYKDGSVYNGKVVGSVSGKPRVDTNNPDKSKRGRRLLGVVILKGLHAEGDGSYGDGHIYDPSNGKTYKAKATLDGPDPLDARGYIGFSLLGKTQTWHRISQSAEHVHQNLLEKPVGAEPKTQ
jgi:uncharacterized protein (DUF2147 family)